MNEPTTEPMSARDSLALAEHIRRQERLGKAMVDVRASEMMADFEEQLATIYSWDEDATWTEAKATFDAALNEANAKIDTRCEELGIPKRFRPSLYGYWSGRSENATAGRRSELRKVAQTRIAALGKGARVEIGRQSLEIQTQLLSGRLTTQAAQDFLLAMPTAADLMPTLDARQLERETRGQIDG